MSKRASSTHKYAIAGKGMRDTLNPEEQEIYDLCYLAGVEISPAVLRIIFDLLKLNVSPVAIVHMIKSMVHQNDKSSADSTLEQSSRSATATGSRASSSESMQRPPSDRDRTRDRDDRRGRERSNRERDARSAKPRGQKSAGRT